MSICPNCGKEGSHFAPPSMGESSFYICDPNDRLYKTEKEMFLKAPDSQISPSIRNMIDSQWNDPPTSLQILRVLDAIVHYGEGSDFVVTAMNELLKETLQKEGTTMTQIVEKAEWRK